MTLKLHPNASSDGLGWDGNVKVHRIYLCSSAARRWAKDNGYYFFRRMETGKFWVDLYVCPV